MVSLRILNPLFARLRIGAISNGLTPKQMHLHNPFWAACCNAATVGTLSNALGYYEEEIRPCWRSAARIEEIAVRASESIVAPPAGSAIEDACAPTT